MDCPTCEAMVDAYVDGELTASESAAFERALEACPDCRRRLEAARTMSGLLRELPAEPAPDLLRAQDRARAAHDRRRLPGASSGRRPALGRDGGEPDRGGLDRLAGRKPGRPGRARDRRADRGLYPRGHERARRRCRVLRPPYGQAVVRRPHRLRAAGPRPHTGRLPAGRRQDRPRRWPQGGRPGLSPQPAPHRADAVAFIGRPAMQPRRSGSATASRWPTGVTPASRCAPWPISRRAT